MSVDENDIKQKGPGVDKAQLVAFVDFQISHGREKRTVVARLIEKGLSRAEAEAFFDDVLLRMEADAARSAFSAATVFAFFLGGMIGAVIGVGVWLFLEFLFPDAVWSGPAGVVSVGVGVCVGAMVAAPGAGGVVYQSAAALAALIGVGVGEFLTGDFGLCKGSFNDHYGSGGYDWTCVLLNLPGRMFEHALWIGLALLLCVVLTRKRTR